MYGVTLMNEEGVHSLLIVMNGITTLMFLISEIMGMSSCQYNGVMHFIIGDCLCKKKIYVRVALGEEEQTLLHNDIR